MSFWESLSVVWTKTLLAAQAAVPETPRPWRDPPYSSGAGSPMSNYTSAVVIQVLLVAVLLIVLLGGAFLILNLGLLSKRKEDRIGGRTPSDVGILKYNVWPEAPYDEKTLPAREEDEDGDENEAGEGRAA